MNELPNILFLAHRVPYPPNRGDRIRSWNMLKFLARRANVHLACVTEEPLDDDSNRVLADVCSRVHVQPLSAFRWGNAVRTMLTGRSATEGLFASRRLTQTVDRWSREVHFDGVLAFCSSMMQFAANERLREAKLVVDLVDVDSEKWSNYADSAPFWKRPLYRLEAGRVRNLERRIVQQADAVTLVSEAEADLLRSFAPAENIHAVGNGVDLAYFHPRSEGGGQILEETAPKSFTLVFVGVLDYRANVEGLRWFCREVWPGVRERIPHASFQIVGRRPVEAVRRMAEAPGVELVGEVPDVRPHVWNADVVVASLQIARGIQNKVLEAMALSKPVVATPQAVQGIAAVDGEHLLAPSTAEGWIAALAELAGNSRLRATLSQDGRSLVETEYNWAARLHPLAEILAIHRSQPVDRPQPEEVGLAS